MWNNKEVTIMRGVPGSGKSHWVQRYRSKSAIISADNFFVNPKTGVYEFNPELLGKAHDNCLRQYLNLIHEGHPDIVVDNTNIKAFELATYYRVAEALGYRVGIMQMMTLPDICISRNIHNVPPNIILSMYKSMEPIPTWWNIRYINGTELEK